MSQPKLDEKQLEQFSRQLEEQLRKQVYDVISQFLDEDPAANQSTPQAGTPAQPQQNQSDNIGNMFHSLANFVGNAVQFSMNTLNQQKKQMLRQAQQQLQVQMDLKPVNPTPANNPENNTPANNEANVSPKNIPANQS